MKRNSIITAFAITLLALPLLVSAGEPTLTGDEIARMVDEREDGDDVISTSKFILENKRGQQRIRETTRYWKDYDGRDEFEEKSVIFFQSPPDIKDTGFLNWSYLALEQDDDQWLYLPALKKVKRIASDNKDDYFMGTDLTYDDMGDRKIEEDNHNLLREEVLNGKECYVVEAIPKDKDYMYSKRISWVDKKEFIPYQTLFLDRKGRELKKLTTDWMKVSDIWTTKRLFVENYSNGHKTTIEISDVKMNSGVKDKVFVKRTLKKGL